ncbi:hypothetical protein EVAR_78090_1 [Eumeta japonica]|uniref:Uncharacterized protein n=1 Tax=Eumeta variegata TaxID=151549 RepID=A0A4C1T091_EUMVA|nr:hypothetical protein EVAR_78090_1 [Eumeta japonica]
MPPGNTSMVAAYSELNIRGARGKKPSKTLIKENIFANSSIGNIFDNIDLINGDASPLNRDTEVPVKISLSTWGRRSCKVTWRSGQRSSQIDHIITESYNGAKFEYIKGYWTNKANSDHKIIFGEITKMAKINTPPNNRKRASREKNNPSTYRFWNFDYTLLNQDSISKKYGKSVEDKVLTALYQQGQNPLDWNQLNEILRSSVIEHLKFNKNKSKTSRLALAKFMKAKFWKNRSPKDPATIQNFKDARKELLDLQEKRMKRNVNTFSHRCTKFVDPNE